VTIEERLILADGRPTGFDYMRIALAMMIVVFHTCAISYGTAAQNALATGQTRPFWAIILIMFFALSGFLVAMSLTRSKTVISFLGLRLLRLGPALIVESVISLLFLGAIFTTLPIQTFFSRGDTWSYLLNIIGIIHFTLPGVFESNPNVAVNGQLWTLPWELKCYGVIAFVSMFGAFKSKRWLVITLLIMQLGASWRFFTHQPHDIGLMNNWGLVLAFMYGIAIYRFRNDIIFSATICAIAMVLSIILLSAYQTYIFSPLPVAYMTVYLGLLRPKVVWPLTTGDYSYPIFLYGYPIQQAVAAVAPWSRHWSMNLALSLPLIWGVSALSWHFVEKPAQKFRRPLFKFEASAMSASAQALSALRRASPFRHAAVRRAAARQELQHQLDSRRLSAIAGAADGVAELSAAGAPALSPATNETLAG
jgi:peptidoglycan/LPS O-acetylase OafA/YrhL